MKIKNVFVILFLMIAGTQASWGQGFRIYKTDGTIVQFSLRTDSIVFYDGIGTDVDFGPFTPVNQMIVGTWYKSKSETMTFRADGTTDYMVESTYKFFPYQGNIVFFNAFGAPTNILKVYEVTAEKMIVGSPDGSCMSVWSSSKPQPADEHEWVDLGLPSKTFWATCNVGASSPEEYGDYFAWGETKPKTTYNLDTYFDTEDGGSTFQKYNNNGGLTELQPEDDAATANWGSGWKMPSQAQMEELYNSKYTTTEWTTLNGVNGRKITSKSNNNSIFLPAAGCRWGDDLYLAGSGGNYWSSSFCPPYDDYAYYLYFGSGSWNWNNWSGRGYGLSVRAVRP